MVLVVEVRWEKDCHLPSRLPLRRTEGRMTCRTLRLPLVISVVGVAVVAGLVGVVRIVLV